MFVAIGFWEFVIIVMVIAATIGTVYFRMASAVPARSAHDSTLAVKRGRVIWVLSGLLFLLVLAFFSGVWAS